MPHISPFLDAGNLVFISGTLPFDAEGNVVQGDIAVQTQRVLHNIAGVLSAANLSRTDLVKLTVWLTDASDFDAFDATYAEFFGEQKPSRSTTVAELVVPGAKIEIEAIARRPA